jgi:hypothetical protein
VFQRLLNDAKSAVSSVVLKYVARASVAIPFLIAAGFALAAISTMLVQRFGYVAGYWLMAGGLAALGVIAAIAVSVKEHEEEVADQQAEETDTSRVVAEVASQAPLALLSGLLAMPGGGASALTLARLLGRNWPLVLLLGVIATLLWPGQSHADEASEAELPSDDVVRRSRPDGFEAARPY